MCISKWISSSSKQAMSIGNFGYENRLQTREKISGPVLLFWLLHRALLPFLLGLILRGEKRKEDHDQAVKVLDYGVRRVKSLNPTGFTWAWQPLCALEQGSSHLLGALEGGWEICYVSEIKKIAPRASWVILLYKHITRALGPNNLTSDWPWLTPAWPLIPAMHYALVRGSSYQIW